MKKNDTYTREEVIERIQLYENLLTQMMNNLIEDGTMTYQDEKGLMRLIKQIDKIKDLF